MTELKATQATCIISLARQYLIGSSETLPLCPYSFCIYTPPVDEY